MYELTTNPQTMTSLQIADITGKSHSDILKAIRKMEPAWEKVHKGKFSLMQKEVEIGNGATRMSPYYSLTKTECLYIATKFNDEARAILVKRWEELETQYLAKIPKTFSQALYLCAQQAEDIERKQLLIERNNEQIHELTNKVQEMVEKVSYVDRILQSKSTATVTQIAQDYGKSAKAFNKILASLHIQRKVGGQWVLYSNYIGEGYVHSKPTEIFRNDGTTKVIYNTEWTTKGRLFLYNILKNNDIIPLIEQ